MHILIDSVFSWCCCCPLVLYVVAVDFDAYISGCHLFGSAILLNHMAAFVFNSFSCIFLYMYILLLRPLLFLCAYSAFLFIICSMCTCWYKQ